MWQQVVNKRYSHLKFGACKIRDILVVHNAESRISLVGHFKGVLLRKASSKPSKSFIKGQ